MLKIKTLRPEYVKHFPDSLDEGVLYISEEYASVGHRCCCGCGEEVITPINPAQWQLRKSRAGVSLYPSVGNWKFKCQSHYWITDNKVEDAGPMSQSKIDLVKQRDRMAKDRLVQHINDRSGNAAAGKPKKGLFQSFMDWWLGSR